MKRHLTIIACFFILGCETIPKKSIHLDPSALKQEERTFVINQGKLKLPNGNIVNIVKEDPQQMGQWFVVHEDYIKEHNENQDNLISSFNDQISLKKQMNWWRIGCIAASTVTIILVFLFRRRK